MAVVGRVRLVLLQLLLLLLLLLLPELLLRDVPVCWFALRLPSPPGELS